MALMRGDMLRIRKRSMYVEVSQRSRGLQEFRHCSPQPTAAALRVLGLSGFGGVGAQTARSLLSHFPNCQCMSDPWHESDRHWR